LFKYLYLYFASCRSRDFILITLSSPNLLTKEHLSFLLAALAIKIGSAGIKELNVECDETYTKPVAKVIAWVMAKCYQAELKIAEFTREVLSGNQQTYLNHFCF
jgi:hypothetical protein